MPRYLTEFVGTFFLALAVCLAAPQGGVAAAICIGGALAVMVYMGGNVSGAHYNPAVSVALVLRGALEAKDLAWYVAAQLVGAVAAALIATQLSAHGALAPAPAAWASPAETLLAEALATFALALVIMNVATTRAAEGNSYYGVAIGGTVMWGVLAVGEISGGVFNPAVGAGPILSAALAGDGGYGNLWYYVAGPLAGALAAVPVFKLQHGDRAGSD